MKTSIGLSIAITAALMGLGACVADDPGTSPNDTSSDGGGGDGAVGSDGSTSSDGAAGGDSSAPPTAPPTHPATAVSFVDIDPTTGTVGGTILITKAANESDVSAYVIYLTDASGAKPSAPLASVKATGKNVTYAIPEGTAIPGGISQVLVTTKNAIGEMASGPTGNYADAKLHSVSVTDSSSPITRAILQNANVLFDESNRKLIVVTGDLSAFACQLSDESCKREDISAGLSGATDVGASAIDTTNGKLITLAAGTNTIEGVFAPLDLSSAAHVDLTNGLASNAQDSPAIAVDQGKKLYVVTSTSSTDDNVFDCALDGTGCSTPKSLLSTESGGNSPSLAIDDNTESLFVGSNAFSNSNPYVLKSPLSLGSAGVETSAESSGGGGIRPTMLVDATDTKTLLVATDSSYSAFLYICNGNGGACTTTTLTTGTYANTAEFAQAAIDLVDKKLIVVTEAHGTNSPAILRCNLDGTSCTHTDFSSTGASGRSITVAIDPESGQVFGLAQSTTGGAPFLFFMQ